MADTVLYEVDGGLATITLNRPGAMNAVNNEAKSALRDAVLDAAGDNSIRAVLLTAAGDRAFCVGQDLKEHIGLLSEARASESGNAMSTVGEHYNPIVRALAEMPKPVVAGINGVAAGAGLGFALACDYRVMADTATFTTAFAGVGLSADSGLSWTLPRFVGPGTAAELLLFPRSHTADEARAMGVVNRVVPAARLAETARSVARELAEGPTLAYASLKESLAYALDHSLEETLAKEAELQTRAGASEDHATAVRAFTEKTRPRFQGR
ncbi:enoyl-CoA hydratase/isomerase family protein [Streptomyces sp. NPDC050560]|uniref:enoyl-CoA hydratase/isomerase family protein n=1 Tax=Streptomyces sp. NPDC050560 TaxID=3365630 RepID=UPI003790A765